MNAPHDPAGTRRGAAAVAAMGAAAAALVISYLALGGGSYKPLEVADPCKPRTLPPADGFEQVSQQIVLSALDGAACRLRVKREELALALTDEEARQRFAREYRISDEALEAAIRNGFERAVDDADRAGRLSQDRASLLRSAVRALPIGTLLEAFRMGKGLLEVIGELLDR